MPSTAHPAPAVACSGLTVVWPDGTPALDGLDVTFGTGRTGLIGRNGSGKSTVLRAVAGLVRPTRGTVHTTGEVALLPQDPPRDPRLTVAHLLGIADTVAALRAIESGDTDERHFDAVGEDWDVEERATAALDRLGVLPGRTGVLDRGLGTLSGGELTLTAIAGLLVRRAPISLLDEPSNNLDGRARAILVEAVDSWPGVLILASHDRALLDHVDTVVELYDGHARSVAGGYAQFEAALQREQDAARRAVRAAAGDVDRQLRDTRAARTVLSHRARTAARAEREKRVPKIIAHGRRMQAEVSAARYTDLHAARLDSARSTLREAEARVREDDVIRVDLPATEVPAGRDVLTVGGLVVRGPERIALTGPNGSGKTTLLDALAGRRAHPRHAVPAPRVPTGYLPQRQDLLDDTRTVLDTVRAHAPQATPHDVRAHLARFLVRGDRVDLPVGALSGGERLRVLLAGVLLADPAPQLLLLDEPTNNLDLDSVRQLAAALRDYRGALLVVSHDERFLADIGVTRRWRVSGVGLPVADPDSGALPTPGTDTA